MNKRFSDGYQISANYTWQKAKGHSDNYFLWDPNQNYGVQGWNRTNIFNLTLVWELPYGKGRKHGADMSNVMEAILGGWQFNANHTIQSGVPFDVGYNDAGADRDTGTNRPNLIGNADGPKRTDAVVQRSADWRSEQRLRPPGERHIRQHAVQHAPGPLLPAH